MITVKKLYTLKTGTKLRKIAKILDQLERDTLCGIPLDLLFLSSLFNRMREDEDCFYSVKAQVPQDSLADKTNLELRIILNRTRHELLKQLDISPADWDFINPPDKELQREVSAFKGFKLFLDDLRSPFNIGSIFRTAECFGIEEILLSPGCSDPLHPRSQRTAMGCIDKVPWRRIDIPTLLQEKLPLFALELGGESIRSFTFPNQGILIIGSEELGVSQEALNLCRESLGLVSIPLWGSKGSMNVSVATGILLNTWVSAIY